MGVMDSELVALPTDTGNVNTVKDIVLEQLHDDGVITKEQLKEYGNGWHIIIIKNGWFKNIVRRLGLNNKGSYFYKYVKFTLET